MEIDGRQVSEKVGSRGDSKSGPLRITESGAGHDLYRELAGCGAL